MTHFLFYLAFATLLAHELDAVQKREWQILFVLRALPEPTARRAFALLHIPLVTLILWLVGHPSEAVRLGSQVSLDLFMVMHAGLHWWLEPGAAAAFKTRFSRALIYSAALLAFLHLGVLVSRPR